MPGSPSSVNDFLACPRLWWLKRQGVQGRVRDESAMNLGIQFHSMMAEVMNGGAYVVAWAGKPPLVSESVAYVMEQEGDTLKEQGVIGTEVNLGGDPAEAARHGRYSGTCDLVTENGTGLTVTDYKTKMHMASQYADRELRETQRSWQLKQYAWFVQEQYGRPVTHVRKLLVTFGPVLKVWLVSYPVTQQELSAWYEQAKAIWWEMDQMLDGLMPTWQNGDSCERYGWEHRCVMYGICWEGETG